MQIDQSIRMIMNGIVSCLQWLASRKCLNICRNKNFLLIYVHIMLYEVWKHFEISLAL